MTMLEPSSEGHLPFKIPSIDKPCSTYYKIFGDLSQGIPVIVMHGGPGAGHDYLLPFAELWPRFGLPVVFYDQIGCGQSTHLPETKGDKSFWQESLFVAELGNLIDGLNLRLGFHLFGHSFGGMIGPAFAASQPPGLHRLVIGSGIPSKDLNNRSFDEVKSLLPEKHQQAISDAVQSQSFDAAEYKEAIGYMMKTFMCRAAPPPVLLASNKNMADDNTVRSTMAGPSPWMITGSMQGWTCIPRLHRITVPTLTYNAEHDTSSRDLTQVPFFELIPRVRQYRFNNAGHMLHLESDELKDRVLKLVGDFLCQRDEDSAA
ncbi:hypothetical protein ANO11243_090990 [Dothideomycetidae sp. 11243]|nr:hypothetical protein ANO11243_090990 [fungal sp. No.11243]